ncbi:MAG: mono/diheme cytochrome c family protein, partial [Rhodothermales bacterium]
MTNLSHFKCVGTWLTPVLAAGLAWFSLQAAQAEPAVDTALTAKSASEQPELDPTVLKDKATTVMETYCISCHGPEKQKGDVRLDALAAIDPVDLQKLYATAKEMVHFAEMPPEKVDQPSDAERKILLHWLNSQLTGKAAKALAEKLLRFEYGNVVNHEDLFSGDYADLPAYSPDRRWMISEFIFNEKVNRLLNYSPMRTIAGVGQQVEGDSGIHWSPKSERGDKFRRSITNPFLLSEKSGVRYYVHDRLTTGHLLTMVGNAKRIAGHMTSEGTIKAQYPAMYALTKAEFDDRELLRSREQFLTTYSYMGRLLKDIYKDQHEALLPALKHTEELYPGPPMHKNKIGKRQTNLGLIGRLDGQDVQAIYRGIAAYQAGDFEVEEIAPQGDDGYATYAKPSRNEYNSLILQSERDWIMEGVSDYRRTNRITIMKLFYDQWHLPAIYKHVAGNDYGIPQYTPLSDVEMAVIIETIKTHRRQGDTYRKIIENCMADWQASLGAKRKAAAGASDALLGDLVIELYNTVHERVPTAAELADNLALMKSYTDKLEMQQAIAKLVESLVLNTDFAYRHEFGVGEADTHGRRMMSPRDASYALAYALTDSSPDAELTQAASAGKLSTRQDYEREVRRMLRRRDQWTIIDEAVQAANINSSVTNQPIRKLRFFRDFFGYPKAMKVFKDDHRFGAGRHEPAVSRLIDEADLLVEYILEQDKKVFEELLTTDSFYVYHSGDNTIMQAASDRLKAYYDHFKEFNWEEWEAAELFPHKAFIQQSKVLGGEKITSAEDDAKEN